MKSKLSTFMETYRIKLHKLTFSVKELIVNIFNMLNFKKYSISKLKNRMVLCSQNSVNGLAYCYEISSLKLQCLDKLYINI